jgi:hypothetical protein
MKLFFFIRASRASINRLAYCALALALAAHSAAASFERIVEESSPAIVVIESGTANGSGVLLSSEGLIVTNLHVLEGAIDLSVRTSSGERFDDVSVVDFDETRDLALIKIKGFDLPAARIGNSNSVRRGQQVFAVGAPLGYEQTVSSGIVSAVRMMEAGFKAIQTDAAISPGSSGGGLFNSEGELIGILTAYREDGQNLNFALPINYARGMLDQPVSYSEQEFISLEARTPVFGEEKSAGSGTDKLMQWFAKLESQFEEIEVSKEDEDTFVVNISDGMSIAAVLYGDLLWMFTVVEEDGDPSKELLRRLLTLSPEIDYAYFSVSEDAIMANIEFFVPGSDYDAFLRYLLSLLSAAMKVEEDGLLLQQEAADKVSISDEVLGLQLPDLKQKEYAEGSRPVEPANLGLRLYYRAFLWDVDTDEGEGSVTFGSRTGEERYAKVFVERIDYEIDDVGRLLEALPSNFLDSVKLDNVQLIGSGRREVQESPAISFRYSGSSAGIRFYWQTTAVCIEDRLLTFHTWMGTPTWSSMDNLTADFLGQARF